jgi:hypothetical protein
VGVCIPFPSIEMCHQTVNIMGQGISIITIIIIITTICFMKGIYTYIPQTNNVPKQYNVTAILSLLCMVPISLVRVLTPQCTFTLALSEVCYYYYYLFNPISYTLTLGK